MGNRKGALFAAMLASLAIVSGVQSQGIGVYMSGELLTKHCRAYLSMRQSSNPDFATSGGQAYSAGTCYAFVVGVQDALGFRGFEGDYMPPFCIPEGANAHSMAEVVARYLNQHPEKRDKAGYFLTREALAEGFPCK